MNNFLAYSGAWATVMAGVWLLFEKADRVVSPGVKRSVGRWLTRLNVEKDASNWPSQFARVFDATFGRQHLTLRCFFASAVASSAAFGVAFLLIRAMKPDVVAVLGAGDFPFTGGLSSSWQEASTVGWMVTFGCLGPDYVSLLVTRWFIGRMEKAKSARSIVLLLIADAVVTAYIAAVVTLLLLRWILSPFLPPDLPITWSILWAAPEFIPLYVQPTRPDNTVYAIMSPLYFSAFFTSVWLWLYALSIGLVRVAARSQRVVRFVQRNFDIKQKPFASIGYVCMLVVTVVFALGPLVGLIF